MLDKLKWTRECRIGIDEIDTQHRLLFAIAGELKEIDKPDEQGPEIKYLINHIRKYVKDHFEDEERFMEKINYPGLDEHKKIHKLIVEEINHTLTTSKNLNNLLSQLEYLMSVWIKDHILGEDKKFAAWHAANPSPDRIMQ